MRLNYRPTATTFSRLFVFLFGKALFLAAGTQKDGSDTAYAYPGHPDLIRQQSWNLPTGVVGNGYNYIGWCEYPPGTGCPVSPPPQYQWRVRALTHKSAATDNKIGARAQGYDRCSSSSPWLASMDTTWKYKYSGSTSVPAGYTYGQFLDCPEQGEGHFYRNTTSHLYTQNNPYMNTTRTINVFP